MKNAAMQHSRTDDDSMPSFPAASGKRITRRLKDYHGGRIPLLVMREARDLTQADVAKAMGCEQSEVSRIERRTNVQLATLQKYAAALGGRCDVVFVFPNGHRYVIVDPTDDR